MVCHEPLATIPIRRRGGEFDGQRSPGTTEVHMRSGRCCFRGVPPEVLCASLLETRVQVRIERDKTAGDSVSSGAVTATSLRGQDKWNVLPWLKTIIICALDGDVFRK